MDTREKAGLSEKRDLLLQEISMFRYTMREHCFIARGGMTHARNNVLSIGKVLHVAPAAASFAAGLMRGKRSAKHPKERSKVRGVLSTALAGYALWKSIR